MTRGTLLQDGAPVASLAADKAIYNIFTRDVATPGDAELTLEDGPSFKVRKVFWNARKSKLFCEEGVDAVLDGSTMHGERMTADLQKKELAIYKVRGQIKLEE